MDMAMYVRWLVGGLVVIGTVCIILSFFITPEYDEMPEWRYREDDDEDGCCE